MRAQTSERIDTLLAIAREQIETLHTHHRKVLSLAGFVRDDALLSVFAIPSCCPVDQAFACAVGSVGYQADGVFLLGEGMAAVTQTNPLTGFPWKAREIAQVLHLDGGLGVVERDISLAYLERDKPCEQLTQTFTCVGDRLLWTDVYCQVESEKLPLHSDVAALLRFAASHPERISSARPAIEQILVDALIHSLRANPRDQRDRATTQALLARGFVAVAPDEATRYTLPEGLSPRQG